MRDFPMCPRCKCCSTMTEGESCWFCIGDGGFDEYDDDPINYEPGERITPCPECDGTGTITVTRCLGECDENGKHTHSVLSKASPEKSSGGQGPEPERTPASPEKES